MSWTSYLFPKIVARTTSPYNHDIRILEEKGKYKLLVNGSRQSGDYVRELWQYALCRFGIIPSPDIRSILVMGVGGGNVIQLLSAIYPHADITGVDIDPEIVRIGKKYFGLDRIKNLHLTISDARRFVTETHKTWDLVIVDTFIGPTIPAFVQDRSFLLNLKRITKKNGILVINYLREREYRVLSNVFFSKLKELFPSVGTCEIYYNRFFCCGKIASCLSS